MTKLVILDFDDTLCNHTEAHRKAQARVNMVLRDANIPGDKFWTVFESIEPTLRESMSAGFISSLDYRWRRFSDVCARFCSSVGVLPDAIEKIYRDETVNKIRLYDDVLPALSLLRQHGYRIAILSNGEGLTQREKIRRLGISRFVRPQDIFISEEMGCSKPDPEAFARVLRDTAVPAKDALMVGHSLESDVRAAQRAGIRALLLDRNNQNNFYPDRIDSLEGLILHIEGSTSQEDAASRTASAPSGQSLYNPNHYSLFHG